ncbi:MAG TPA: methyltransferase domain-containing protein [Bryobacteraceae bacterium]|nr:methyltransferase domain-containing protein [Bryobacteraceae bacterium]
MKMTFPAPPGFAETPVWNGHHFQLGGKTFSVLAYETGTSNWSDELTQLHEDLSGEHHYIDVASREHTIGTLQRHLRVPSPVIMDIGCSSGFMLRDLRKRMPGAQLVGADYVARPLEKLSLALPDVPFLQFNLVTCPLPGNSADAVILLNVLEHIEDDFTAMQQTFRILKPGGIAVIELPAGPHLYDVYDKQLMHFRRYRMRGLLSSLRGTGFDILEKSHLGFFLYPAFAAVKLRNRRYLSDSEQRRREIVAADIQRSKSSPLLGAVMRLEGRLRRYVLYPFGIRCLVTCRKPLT